jgi:S1-C subfamily serine protease
VDLPAATRRQVPRILPWVEPGDVFDADEPPAFRTPPAPDDRLWRHPSELRWAGPPPRRRVPWPVAVLTGITGAALTIGALALTGSLGGHTEIVVRQATLPGAVAFTSGADPAVARVAATVTPAIVRLDGGSGVLFRSDGHVLTNAHVVGPDDQIEAIFPSGVTIAARVVARDETTDLAVVKLDGDGPFPTAVLGTSDGMAVGQPTIVVGATVTAGMVSALGREITRGEGALLLDMIQTDAPVGPRSSGGALVDSDGTVVGIANARAGAPGLGFATPVDVARAVADDLLRHGRVRLVWLGIKGGTAPDGGGVAVAQVLAGGPAAAAGIHADDVIRRIGKQPIASMTSLWAALRRHHPGEPVTVVYDRGEHRGTAVVVLAERPE